MQRVLRIPLNVSSSDTTHPAAESECPATQSVPDADGTDVKRVRKRTVLGVSVENAAAELEYLSPALGNEIAPT
jgi:hypothetical protein